MSSTVARACIAAVGGCLVFLVVVWLAFPWVFGDTPFVLDATDAFRTCLSQHQFHACGFTHQLNQAGLMSPMGDWPLLQHVPDLIATTVGASSHAARTRVLEALNVAAVVASVVSARIVFVRYRRRPLFWAFVLVLIASPILWYARTTSGEVFAAGLLVCFAATALMRAHPAVVGVAAFAASLTKETSYPFVFAFGVVGLMTARRRTGEPIRRHVIGMVAGIAVAFAAASFFNLVRYGSIWNTNYLDSRLHTPGIGRKLDYAAAMLVAPNGGILFFWPVATALLVTALVVGFRRRRDRLPAVILAAATVVLIVGFASWWTPFGWGGFGPRLMVPWVPSLVLLALAEYAEDVEPLLRRFLASGWRLIGVFTVTLAFTLPAIGETWRPNAIVDFFAQERPPCQAPFHPGGSGWFACQQRQMWTGRPMQIYALHGVGTPAGLATALFLGLGIAGCLLLIRNERSRLGERRTTVAPVVGA
jgi:hypothetical protein